MPSLFARSCVRHEREDMSMTVLSTGAPVARRPLAVDLFCGAGGLSLGLEQAGFDVAAAVEYDPVHAAVHEFNFPKTSTLCADISRLSPDRLLQAVEAGAAEHGQSSAAVDVITGGPPCQGFSLIGRRLIDDPRNQLVFHFLRLVAAIQPRYFVMENVPGMTKGGHAGVLGHLVREFQAAGYQVVLPHLILNAADYGVPQERYRLFLLGAREGEPLPSYPTASVVPVPKRSSNAFTRKEGENLGPSVSDALQDLPNLNRFPTLLDSDCVRLSEASRASMDRAASSYARRLRGLANDANDFSYAREWDPSILSGSMRTVHTAESTRRFRSTPIGRTEPISRFYRLDPDGLCNTLRAGSGSERGAFTSPRPLHPSLPRVLSVREAARLHSFPDWFRFHETKWHGFRQIGNAVAPLVGRAVGAQVIEALGSVPGRPRETITLGSETLLGLTMSEAAERFGAAPDAIPATRRRSTDPQEAMAA